MTCKDTPLHQRGHMEVLQWLLGKQCGQMWDELARSRDGWSEEEVNVVQHKREQKTKQKK